MYINILTLGLQVLSHPTYNPAMGGHLGGTLAPLSGGSDRVTRLHRMWPWSKNGTRTAFGP